MKLFVKDENKGCDILKNYVVKNKKYAQAILLNCLPNNSSEYYVSFDSREYDFVKHKYLWDYPFVKINSYPTLGCDDIDNRGIRLLAFNIYHDTHDLIKVKLGGHPSFISIWRNIIQIIFRLKDVIPVDTMSHKTETYLASTIKIFEKRIKCTRTGDLLNPFCKDVESYIFNTAGLTLKEIETASYHPVSAKRKKEAKARAAIASTTVQRDKSRQSIKTSIQLLRTPAGFPTQTRVAEHSGVSRQAVNRHWKPVIDKFFSED